VDALRLMQEGAWGPALLYVSATVLGCLLLCAAGFSAAKALVGT